MGIISPNSRKHGAYESVELLREIKKLEAVINRAIMTSPRSRALAIEVGKYSRKARQYTLDGCLAAGWSRAHLRLMGDKVVLLLPQELNPYYERPADPNRGNNRGKQ